MRSFFIRNYLIFEGARATRTSLLARYNRTTWKSVTPKMPKTIPFPPVFTAKNGAFSPKCRAAC